MAPWKHSCAIFVWIRIHEDGVLFFSLLKYTQGILIYCKKNRFAGSVEAGPAFKTDILGCVICQLYDLELRILYKCDNKHYIARLLWDWEVTYVAKWNASPVIQEHLIQYELSSAKTGIRFCHTFCVVVSQVFALWPQVHFGSSTIALWRQYCDLLFFYMRHVLEYWLYFM